MTEKKFLCCVLSEGILLFTLGLLMITLPRITTLTFGMLISLSFIIYGGYKSILAFITKNYTRHYLFNLLLGLCLFTIGGFIFISPMFNILIITSLIGAYFTLESVSTFAFAFQNRETLTLWQLLTPAIILQFLFGLIILLSIPATSLWGIGIISAINFLITGITMIFLFIATKYNYSI